MSLTVYRNVYTLTTSKGKILYGGPAGIQGPAGPPGSAGATGDDGPAGPAGDDGLSAYEVAVAEGFVGNEAAWLASLVGPQGPEGDQGPAGNDGAPGATGSQGPAGDTGPAGADGDSAYQVWLDEGNTGTEQDFLDSLISVNIDGGTPNSVYGGAATIDGGGP